MSEETELQRVCSACGGAIPIESGICPTCTVRRAIGSEYGQAAAIDSNESGSRFEHFQVLLRDGKPVELGRGGMGVTYKAIDTNLGTPVALKVINQALREIFLSFCTS